MYSILKLIVKIKIFFFVYIYIFSDLDMTLNCMLTLCFHNAFPPSDPGSDSSNLLAHWNSLLHSDRGWGDRGQHQPTYILQIINKKPKGYIAHLSSSLFYTSFKQQFNLYSWLMLKVCQARL